LKQQRVIRREEAENLSVQFEKDLNLMKIGVNLTAEMQTR